MTKIVLFCNIFLQTVTILCLAQDGLLSSSRVLAFSVSPPTSLRANPATACRRNVCPSPFDSSKNTETLLQRSFRESHSIHNYRQTVSSSSSSKTSLSMYNLPPGGGGGGGGKNDVGDIAKGALSIALTIAFFASPLGGIVLSIFNSFFVFLLVTPLVLTVGFQLWQKLNTVEAACPSCGVQVTVMKSQKAGGSGGVFDTGSAPTPMSPQTMCFQCGAMLQANEDNTGINNVSGRTTIDDLNSSPMGGPSLFDFFANSGAAPTDPWSTETTTTPTETTSTSSTSTASSNKSGAGKGGIDKSAVVDVEVLDEDKPFQ